MVLRDNTCSAEEKPRAQSPGLKKAEQDGSIAHVRYIVWLKILNKAILPQKEKKLGMILSHGIHI